MAILVPQQEDVAREAFLVDPTKADDGKARAAARVLAKEALKAQTIAEMPEGTFKTEEEKAGAASRIVELMTGEKDYDGRLWNGGKGFKTGAEYLRSVQEAVRRGTQAAMDPDLQAWLRMTDEQKDAKVEAEQGFQSKFGESVGDVGDALGEVVRGVPQLSKEEYESAPAEVREASDAMGSVVFGDMPEKERGEYEAKVREWRGSDWQKLKRRSEYEAKLRRKNALVYLPDMIRTLETDDAKELAGELAQNPEEMPANWTARLKQLPTRDIETLAQIRGMTREHVEGGFFNTLGDMGIAAYNGARRQLSGIGAQEAKYLAMRMGWDGDRINEMIRRKHALWRAYAGWSAPKEQISDDHGAIANFAIGIAGAVPFIALMKLKWLGYLACATEMMSEADAKAAAEGIDVTNPAYCAQSALMGGLYAYCLKAVSPKFFGATAKGAAEEMALRTAFLKGVLSGCAKLDTAKVMSQRTAAGAFMMAMQQGIAAINEDLNLGGDAWRDASQRFAETFVSSIPDMLAFSAHGVLEGHARNSGGWRRMFGAEGRANRSQNLRDAVETAFAVKTAVNGQRGIEDRRRATLIAQIAEMGRAWTEGGEKALAKLGLKPEEIAEAKDYFEAERRRFGAAERLSELNDAGGVEWSPGEEPVDIETAAEQLDKAFAEARTAQGVLAERLLGKMKDESGAVRDLASVRNIWAEGHAVGAGRKDGDSKPDIDHDAGAAALVKAGFAPKDASELSRAFGAERMRMYSPDAAEALRALYTRSTRGQVEATAALASAFGGKMRTVGWRTYLDIPMPDGGTATLDVEREDLQSQFYGETGSDPEMARQVERATGGAVKAGEWIKMTDAERREVVEGRHVVNGEKVNGLVKEGDFALIDPNDPTLYIVASDAERIVGRIKLDPSADPGAAFHEAMHGFLRFAQKTGFWDEADVKWLQDTYGKPQNATEQLNEENATDGFRQYLARRLSGSITEEPSAWLKLFSLFGRLRHLRERNAAVDRIASNAEEALYDQLLAGKYAHIRDLKFTAPAAPKAETGGESAAPQTGAKPKETAAGNETKRPADETKQGNPETKQGNPETKQGDAETKSAKTETEPGNSAPRVVRWEAQTPKGNKYVGGYYQIFKLSDLIHSNHPLYKAHEALQGRNRKDNKREEEQRGRIKAEFNGRRYLDNAVTSDGAPLVAMLPDEKGVVRPFVVSGNGRVLVLNELAESHLYDKYRDPLKEWAEKNGVENGVADADNPVLVRVVDDLKGSNLLQVSRLSNVETTTPPTETELARTDAEHLRSLDLAKLYHANADGSPDMTPGVNDEFFRMFSQGPSGETIFDEDRYVGEDAQRRVMRAFLHLAVGDSPRGLAAAQKLITMSGTYGIDRQKGALQAMAPDVARTEANPDYSIGPDVARAIADFLDFVEMKRAGKVGTYSEYAAQGDMLDPPSEIAADLTRTLAEASGTARDMAERVKAYADVARLSDADGALGGKGSARSREDVWREAGKLAEQRIVERKRQDVSRAGGVRFSVDPAKVRPATKEEYDAALSTWGDMKIDAGNVASAGWIFPDGRVLKPKMHRTAFGMAPHHDSLFAFLERPERKDEIEKFEYGYADSLAGGAVRLNLGGGGIEVMRLPTAEQLDTLYDALDAGYGLMEEVGEDVLRVDVDRENGSTVFTAQYRRGTSARRIMDDLREWFESAKVPDAAANARFSISGIHTGSAADYDKPSLHYVGSGEGSQVYGWGLYGSNVRGVAESYAASAKRDKAITQDEETFQAVKKVLGKSVSEDILQAIYEGVTGNSDWGEVKAWIKRDAEWDDEIGPEMLSVFRKKESELKKVHEQYAAHEQIYEQTWFTNREPGDESHLLKWYEPVSEEQLKWIRDALVKEKNIRDYSKTGYGNVLVALEHYLNVYSLEGDTRGITGETVYKAIDNVVDKDPKAASEFLYRAGIDGVKYPVDSFGAKTVKNGDEAGWNYVAFSDEHIRVDHKWTDGQQRFSIAVTPEQDAAYADAVKRGDKETYTRMLREAYERAGYSPDSGYQGTSAFNGPAPARNAYFETKEERIEAARNGEMEDTSTLGDYRDGIDVNNLRFIVFDPRSESNADPKRKEAIRNIRQVLDGGAKTITMYRSVPGDVKESQFRNGDWITPSRAYAEENARIHGWGDKYRIIEQEVSVEDVWWDGNDIAEWGFDDGKESVYKNTAFNRKLLGPTYDDNGNLIPLSKRFNDWKGDIRYSVTATPQFKRWFGDWEKDPENASKVVDEEGKPLVVWHGDIDPSFTVFDKGQVRRGNGFWFAKDQGEAASYALDAEPRAFYLDIRNPAREADLKGKLLEDYHANGGAGASWKAFIWDKGASEFLRSRGYDGLEFDGKYIVFKSTQIKSATDNTGAFSPANPDIRYSIVSLGGRDVAVVDDLDAARDMNPTMPADVEKYILDHLESGIQMLVGGTASINAETARHFAWSKVRGKYNKSRRMRKARAQSAIVFGDLVKMFRADDTTKQEDYHKQGDEVWKCRLPFGVPQFGNSSEQVAGGIVYDADVIVKDEGGGKFLYDVANLKRNEALTQQLTSQAQDLFGGGKRAAEAVSARAPDEAPTLAAKGTLDEDTLRRLFDGGTRTEESATSAPEGTADNIPNPDAEIKRDPEAFARQSLASRVEEGSEDKKESALVAFVAERALRHGPRPNAIKTIGRLGLEMGLKSVDTGRIIRKGEALAERVRGTVIEKAVLNGDVATATALLARESDIDRAVADEIDEIVAGASAAGRELSMFGERRIKNIIDRQVEKTVRSFNAATLSDIERDTGIDIEGEILDNHPDKFDHKPSKPAKGASGGEKGGGDGSGTGGGEGDGSAAPESDWDIEYRRRIRKEAEERVAKMIATAKERAEKAKKYREERDRLREERRRRAEEAAGRDAEREAELGEDGAATGAEAAIDKDLKLATFADFKTKEEFAAFFRVWAEERYKKEVGTTTLGKHEENRLFPEYYRKSVVRELQDLADKLLPPKGARATVNRWLGEIEPGVKPDTLERVSADVFAFINKNAIRESSTTQVKKFRDGLKEFIKDPQFDDLKMDADRKVTGWVEEAARYIRRICNLSIRSINGEPSQLEQERARLERILDRREKVYDDEGKATADAPKFDMETRRALAKLELLEKYGAMKQYMPGQIADLADEAMRWLNDEAAKLEDNWREARETEDQIRDALTAGIVGPNGQRYQKGKGVGAWFDGLFDSLNGMIRLRLQHLVRFADSKTQQKAKDAINRVMVMLGDGEVAFARHLQDDRAAFYKGLAQIFATPDGKGVDRRALADWLNRMTEAIPKELSEQLSYQGYADSMTYGQMLQLLVSLEQRSYDEAIMANGREGQAKLIRTFETVGPDGRRERVLTDKDILFIDWLRSFYETKREMLSSVTRRMVGLPIDSPDPLYCPVKMYMGNMARGMHVDSSAAWDPIGAVFTRRIAHVIRDFDESATILGQFFDRSAESAKLAAWGERGSIIRGVFTDAGVQESIRRAFGGGELSKILKQLEETFNGGESIKKSPGEIAAADKAMNWMTYLSLGYNPLSAAKQTTSFTVWANALPGGFKDLWRYMTDVDMATIRHIKESDEYRVRYGNDVGSGQDVATKSLNENPSENPLAAFFRKTSMGLLRKGDFLPGGWIAQGLFRDLYNRHLKEGMDAEAADRLAMTETFNMLEETQQSGRTYNTSALAREHGRLGRLLVQFATSPLQQLQYEGQAFREIRDLMRYRPPTPDADYEQRLSEAKGKLVRAAVINHVLLPAALHAVTNLYRLAMGYDPEWEKEGWHWSLLRDVVMGQFSRVFFLGAISTVTTDVLISGKPVRDMPALIPAEGVVKLFGNMAVTARDVATLDYDRVQKDLDRLLKSTSITRTPYDIGRLVTGKAYAERKERREKREAQNRK